MGYGLGSIGGWVQGPDKGKAPFGPFFIRPPGQPIFGPWPWMYGTVGGAKPQYCPRCGYGPYPLPDSKPVADPPADPPAPEPVRKKDWFCSPLDSCKRPFFK